MKARLVIVSYNLATGKPALVHFDGPERTREELQELCDTMKTTSGIARCRVGVLIVEDEPETEEKKP